MSILHQFSRLSLINVLRCPQKIRYQAMKTNKLNLNHQKYLKGYSQHVRNFHLTPQRNIPPVFWAFFKPIAKAASIISGRTLRNWWQKLPMEERMKFLKKFNYNYKHKLIGALSFGALGWLINYRLHLQTTEITHRRRYIAFTDDQMEKIVQVEFDDIWEQVGNNVIPSNHPVYNMVERIMQRLIDSNQDIDFFTKKKWKVAVVDSPVENAFVLPNGYIFVFTGMLKSCHNEDQLAFIIAHEMSHALLNHGAEKLSIAQFLDVVLIFVMGAIWFYMPTDGIAVITQWFYNKCIKLLLDLPYSRKLETEADEVGLQLMAKACYDVRESSAFWSSLDIKEEMQDNLQIPQFISTHPVHSTRVQFLDSKMDEALQKRIECKCAPLKKTDPRIEMKALSYMVRQHKEEEEQRNQAAVGQVVAPQPRTFPPTTRRGPMTGGLVASSIKDNQTVDNPVLDNECDSKPEDVVTLSQNHNVEDIGSADDCKGRHYSQDTSDANSQSNAIIPDTTNQNNAVSPDTVTGSQNNAAIPDVITSELPLQAPVVVS